MSPFCTNCLKGFGIPLDNNVTADELLAFGKQHLAAYKAPKMIYFTQQLPSTKNGKILRREVNPSIALSRSSA
jgi:acetyl-CoA synthetase